MTPKAQSGGIKNITTNNWDDAKKLLSKEDQGAFGLIQTEAQDWKYLLEDVLLKTHQRREELKGREGNFSISIRGKPIVLRDVLGKLVKWVNKFKEVGDTIVQYDPGHAALPWAAVRFLLTVSVKEEETYGYAMEGVGRATEIISFCADLEKMYLTGRSDIVERFRISLVKLYTEVLSFLSKAVQYFNASTKKKILKSVFTTKGAETWFASVDAMQERVMKNKTLVDAERAKANSELTHTMHDQQQLFAVESKQRDEKIESIFTEHLDAKNREEILKSISTIPHEQHHSFLSHGRIPESGRWLLKKDVFQRWQDEKSPSVLWLRGIPGSGKTKLTSLVVDKLREKSLAFFYCARNSAEPERAQPMSILASLVRQLACTDQGTLVDTIRLKYLPALDGSKGFDEIRWTEDELVDTLIDLTGFHQSTVLVLDALDEVNELEVYELLSTLHRVRQKSRGVVKLFFSSRDSEEIKDQLQDHPSHFIDAQDNSEDIEAFVREKLPLVLILKKPKYTALREEAAKKLINGAQGMFRWVELQIQMLRGLKVANDIKARLGHLPETLEQSYWEIFREVQKQDEYAQKLATKTFQWLLCAHAKVRLDTFAALASMDLEDSDEPYAEDEVLRVCLNLVVDDKDGTFRFAHLSVREFLETSVSKSDITEFLAPQANAHIASLCLIQLSRVMDQADSESRKEIQKNILYWEKGLDTITYAIFNSIDHVSSSGDQKSSEPLKSGIKDFVFKGTDMSPGFQHFHQALSRLLKPARVGCGEPYGDLSFCAAVSHHEIWALDVFGLIDDDKLIVPEIDGKQQRHLLEVAIRSRNFSIMEKMLYHGIYLGCVSHENANFPAQNPRAASPGITQRPCIDSKAFMRTISDFKDSQMLATILNEQLSQFLSSLKDAVDLSLIHNHVYDPNVFERSASDLRNGFKRITDRLQDLDLQAEPEMLPDTVIKAALDLARGVMDLNFSVSRDNILLRRQALHQCAVDAKSGARIAEIILSQGAEVEIGDYYGHTPLYLGVRSSNTILVQTLLNNGAQVNKLYSNNRTALHQAAHWSNVEIVRALLKKGAKVNAIDRASYTPLHYAASKANSAIVQCLLEKEEADVHVRDNTYLTPLLVAVNLSPVVESKREHPKIIRMLLERRADVSVRDWLLMTPLHIAAAHGDVEVVEVLLSYKADVDARDVRGLTARGLAEKFGRQSVLRVLPQADELPWDQKAQPQYEIHDPSLPGLDEARKKGIENFEKDIIHRWGDRNGVTGFSKAVELMVANGEL